MVSILDIAERGGKETSERLEETSFKEHDHALFPELRNKIAEGTLTLEEVDYYLQRTTDNAQELKQYLLGKKAWLLLREGQGEQALRYYDEALKVNPIAASTWAMKGAALLELNRPEEAFAAFEEAFVLRENFGPQKQGYLGDLFMGWSLASAILGLSGIAQNDSAAAAKGVQEYLSVVEKAESEDMPEAAAVILEAGEQAEPGVSEDIEEWKLMVELLSIKDPFEGLRALSKEISKYWPEGLSAVDAIREQRDREWNT